MKSHRLVAWCWALVLLAVQALGGQGDLDPRFGNGGIVTTGLSRSCDEVVLQNDGKILVRSGAELRRFDAEGLDGTFGGAGRGVLSRLGDVDSVVASGGTIHVLSHVPAWAIGGGVEFKNPIYRIDSYDFTGTHVGGERLLEWTSFGHIGAVAAPGDAVVVGVVLGFRVSHPSLLLWRFDVEKGSLRIHYPPPARDFFNGMMSAVTVAGSDAFVLAGLGPTFDGADPSGGLFLARLAGGEGRPPFGNEPEGLLLWADEGGRGALEKAGANSPPIGSKLVVGLPDGSVLMPVWMFVGRPLPFDQDGGAIFRVDSSGLVTRWSGILEKPLFEPMTALPDGRVVAAGGSGDLISLWRFLSDGSLDSGFGSAGHATQPLAPFAALPRLAVARNGDVIGCGEDASGTLLLARWVGQPCGDGVRGTDEACDPSADGFACCTSECAALPAGTGCDNGGVCDGGGTCGPSLCGDGYTTGAEECDPADPRFASVCCHPSSCRLLGSAQPCRPAEPGGCDFAEFCTNAGTCPADLKKGKDETCGAGQACDGAGACVPIPSTCGNGVVEGLEQCDDANRRDGDCCSATCVIEGASQVCGRSNNPCVNDSYCDGNAAVCRVGTPKAPGLPACSDDDGCTITDTCDGAGGCVPGQRICSVSQPDVRKNGSPKVNVGLTCLATAPGECRAEAREVVSGQAGSLASLRAEGTAAVIAAAPSKPLRCKRGRREGAGGQLTCKAKLVLRLTRAGRERLARTATDTILEATVQPENKPAVPVYSRIAFLKFLRSRR